MAVMKKHCMTMLFWNTDHEQGPCSNASPHYPYSQVVFTPVNTVD